MVKDFDLPGGEKEVGFYVGFIASSFSLAQFMTSLMWGWVSDRVGRRPVLLVGLLGNAVSLILFGQAKTLRMAIASRMLCGFLNGNVGIAKCIIGEITDSTNQSFGFSLIGIMWSVGTIFGPMIGGCLTSPVTQFPWFFDGWESGVLGWCREFLETNPYFLPCGLSAFVSLVGFGIGFFYMEETNPRIKGYVAVGVEVHCGGDELEEGTGCGVVESVTGCGSTENGARCGRDVFEQGKLKGRVLDPERDAANARTSVETMVVGESSASLSVLEIEDTTNACCHNHPPTQLRRENPELGSSLTAAIEPDSNSYPTSSFNSSSIMSIIAYTLLALHTITLDEAFSLWIVSPPIDGGLGYSSSDVGIALSLIGVIGLHMQLVTYPHLTRTYSPTTLFRAGAILYIIPYLAFPILSGTINPALSNKSIVWTLLLATLTLRQFCSVLTYTSIFILINNSATPNTLGVVNGVAQTSAAFVRTVGPACGGVLWAWSITNGAGFPFNYWFVFEVVVVGAGVLVVQSLFLGEEEEGRGEGGGGGFGVGH
ncbi:hypothetical protein HDU98_004307 [Podochytrium sp. JEL0797]|nr:hypothetical protein HDU98_004307 [Podochytrium sp. JEL0797]